MKKKILFIKFYKTFTCFQNHKFSLENYMSLNLMGKQWLKWDSKKWLTLLQLFQFCSLIIAITKLSWECKSQFLIEFWNFFLSCSDSQEEWLLFNLNLVKTNIWSSLSKRIQNHFWIFMVFQNQIILVWLLTFWKQVSPEKDICKVSLKWCLYSSTYWLFFTNE